MCLICESNKRLIRQCQYYKARNDQVYYSCSESRHIRQNCSNYVKKFKNEDKADKDYVTKDRLSRLSGGLVKSSWPASWEE